MLPIQRNLLTLARIFTALSVLTIGFTNSYASPESSDDLPLDVVLVMDSSGSMKRTDPRELRKPAAKLLISLLGEKDRASVVSFSDNGYPVAYLSPVKGRQNETKLFAAVDRISNKGVYTNLLGAVEGAMRVIKRNPLPHRKSIVVLMTDGKMDLGDAEKNKRNSDRLINDLIPQLKTQNIELHTIAFTDESDKGYLEQIANATGGKFNLAHNDKQLHDVYTSIFEQNKQPNMLPFDGEKFTIDNAIKEVTIVGSKDNEEVVLSLISPQGNVISAANKPTAIKWFTAQAFDLITIKNPQPGQWQIKSSSGKNKAYVITDLKFQLQVEPQEVAIGEGLMIKAWLEDKGNTIDKPSILSNLTMQLQVHTPQGDTHVLDMQPQPKNEEGSELSGVYLNLIALPADGRYQIEVTANGGTFSRVRNTLVKVFDPNAVTPNGVDAGASPAVHGDETTSRTHPEPAPAMPSSADSSGTEEHPSPSPDAQPEIAPAHMVSAHDEAARQSANTQLGEKPNAPSPAEDHVAKTDVKQSMEHGETAEKNTAENNHPEKNAAENSGSENSAHDGPNLMKALLIFLLINGIFALLGGLAYLVYWLKKKKAAKADADTESDDGDAEPNDQKEAA